MSRLDRRVAGILALVALGMLACASAAVDRARNPTRGAQAALPRPHWPVARAARVPVGPAPGAHGASFAYAMGSDLAVEQFLALDGAAPAPSARRSGGRLVVPPATTLALLHGETVAGRVEASADLVMRPGGELVLALRDPQGGLAGARFVAGPASERRLRRPDGALGSGRVELLSEGSTAATADAGLAPDTPHHVRIALEEGELQVEVDGRPVARLTRTAPAPARLLVQAAGGIELRSLRLDAGSLAPGPDAWPGAMPWQAPETESPRVHRAPGRRAPRDAAASARTRPAPGPAES